MTSGPFPLRLGRQTAIILGALTLLLVALAAVTQYTQQPTFCTTCHYMQPFFDSWRASRHSNVPCVDCHYPPGNSLRIQFERRFSEFSMAAKYFTRTYGTKPRAAVSDAACLRNGCHDGRLMGENIRFKNVSFGHRDHLTDDRRGMTLRCTSCHSQIVQGNHMTVTEGSCFLCHFKNLGPEQLGSGCGSCHRFEKKAVDYQGIVFDHTEMLAKGVPCQDCHLHVTQGDGDVRRNRCFGCHAEQARTEKTGELNLVHRTHVTGAGIECGECHEPIEHGLVELSQPFTADCQGCHKNHHAAQRSLYVGTGGRGAPSHPSAMFLTNVTCNGCHTARTGSELMGTSLGGERATCMACHDERYGRVLDRWKMRMQSVLSLVGPMISNSKTELERARRSGRVTLEADSLHRNASYNYNLVRYGRGVHNMEYADLLLRTARDQVARAMNLIGSSYTPPRVASTEGFPDSPCLTCHFGMENRTSTAFGRPFAHGKHLYSCTSCHSGSVSSGQPGHGSLKMGKTQCQRCHHQQKVECASCHELQKNVLAGTGVLSFEPTAGPMSQNVTCDGCHVELTSGHDPKKIRKSCVDCHSPGYDEMMDTWQKDTRDALAAAKGSLAKARERLRRSMSPKDVATSLQSVEKKIGLAEGDGSLGVHNPALIGTILESAGEDLKAIPAGP